MPKAKRIAGKALSWVILLIATVVVLIPIWMIITNAFKTPLEIKQVPPSVFFKPTLSNIKKIVADNFLSYFANSIIITGFNTIISVFFGLLAAYGFWICKSKRLYMLSNTMVLARMVPPITVLIPFYVILSTMHLTGTYAGPILAHSAVNLPFVTWLVLGFMRDLPFELVESGRIDGCTRMGVLWRIITPLLSPAIGSAVLLAAQYSWNELMFSIQLTNIKTYPLTVGVARYVGSMSVDWGKSSAAATLTVIPIIIVGFFMQKHMVRGLTGGAVKG